MFVITRDGAPVSDALADESAVLGAFHRLTSQSMDWAMAHEGYGVIEVPAEIRARDRVIGRYRPEWSRARQWVTVDLHLTPRVGAVTTTTHEAVPYALEFGASGMTITRTNSNDCSGGGQMLDVLTDRTFEPMAPWSRADVRSLHSLWTRWHLNGLTAGCAHMVLPEDRSYDARKGSTCPVTGYRYGTAWLTEVMPDDVLAEVRRLIAIGARAPRWSWGIGPITDTRGGE